MVLQKTVVSTTGENAKTVKRPITRGIRVADLWTRRDQQRGNTALRRTLEEEHYAQRRRCC